MPGRNSAAKRQRQNERRRLRNKTSRSRVRSSVRSFMESVRANDKAAAEARFREMTKLADSAARKGVFHKNMVARKKSRMRRMLNKMGSAS